MNNIPSPVKLYFLYVAQPSFIEEAQLIAAFTNLFEVVIIKPHITTIYLELDSCGLAVISPTLGKL
ncbi:MAG: hypothetical protein KBD37_09395, partial [Burkholderiales bacterium]|nr:hypothetical protein [Burkholderiales bacterium]